MILDDFQDSPSAPPPKKAKTTVKQRTKPKQEDKKPSKTKSEKPAKKERLSLQEKLYQRELEAAITASIKDSQSSDDNVIQLSDSESPVKKTEEKKIIQVNTNKENQPDENKQEEPGEEEPNQQEDSGPSKSPAESTGQDDSKSGEYNMNYGFVKYTTAYQYFCLH